MDIGLGRNFGRENLAAYACRPAETRGRLHREPESPTRTPFQRDRDRIIHSTAFRRLKHKTQVFVHHEGDHFRTRLTHSIEVSQIARALARALKVDEDLAEALALSHDFGHTPFGHAGEDALDQAVRDHGGFDHNAQSLRIVTYLEQSYAAFDGLNLSWETLEGLVKHNGPLTGAHAKDDGVPAAILQFNRQFDLELDTHSSLEAQCAAIADDIAYDAHDLDDGLRANLFTLADIEALPIAGAALEEVRDLYPSLDEGRTRHEVVRRQITEMVEDVIATASSNLQRIKPGSAQEVRQCGETLVCFSAAMAEREKATKTFLYERMYRSPVLMKAREAASRIVLDLYDAYLNGGAEMPGIDVRGAARPRQVADFIAGMTDRFAVREHGRLFDDTPELR